MATHSSTLAWEIPWTEEPGRLQSMGSWRVGHNWATSLSLFTFMHWRRKWQPTPVCLPWESQGREPGGPPSMGSHRVKQWSHAVFWILCLFVSILIFLVLTFSSFPVLPSPGLNSIHSTLIIFGSYLTKIVFSTIVIQSLSCVRLFETPWTAEQQTSLSPTISQSLPNIMSIESVMLSNHLILCHPLLLLPSFCPSIRVFSNELALRIGWPKYWSFSFSISPSNEYSRLISFRIDWFDLFAVQGTLRSLIQHHNSKPSSRRHSTFFMVQVSLLYMTTGKTIALTIWTFASKAMSLLINNPSRLFTVTCTKVKTEVLGHRASVFVSREASGFRAILYLNYCSYFMFLIWGSALYLLSSNINSNIKLSF